MLSIKKELLVSLVELNYYSTHQKTFISNFNKWRFGSTKALPASQGVDGAAGFGWRSFNEVTVEWIDVELTGDACSWLGDRVDMAGRIRLIGCQRQVRLCCGALDLWWTVVVSQLQILNNVWVAFPDLGRSWFDSTGVSVSMVFVGLNVSTVAFTAVCLLLLLLFLFVVQKPWLVCLLPAGREQRPVGVGRC